jgi:hypothetical protein
VGYTHSTSALMASGNSINIGVRSTELVTAPGVYAIRAGVLHRTRLVSPSAISLVAASKPQLGSAPPRVVGARASTDLSFSRSSARIELRAIALRFLHLIA